MTMKRWVRRTLVGVIAASAVFGGLAAWAWNAHGGRHGWHSLSEADAAALRERVVDRVASRLELDAAQRARLLVVADALQAQHRALRAGAPTLSPRAEVQALIAGSTFDRAGAQRLVESKVQAVTLQSPAVLAAFGDFYDGLRPEQQARVREWLARGRHHAGHAGHGGRHGG